MSVVLTVRDDAAGLATALASLAVQTHPPDDIVVVDGGSAPGQLGRVHAVTARYANVRLFTGPPCNIAEGRNRAIAAAQHDVVACLDAGCEAEPEWLARITAPFADPQVEVVGGFYRVQGATAWHRIVGLMTMPGQLGPVDPARFNPSARSLALRKSVWERSGGFPTWLYAAEDTLFDLKLRAMTPAPRYAFAKDAVVRWQPRSSWRSLWRQFVHYARGEARIGRGHAIQRFAMHRYLVTLAAVAVSLVAVVCADGLGALAALLAGGVALARPHHSRAVAVARATGRPWDYFTALAVGEWCALARYRGRRLGQRDRDERPGLYVRKLRQYLGSESADVLIPPWSTGQPNPPRTLIVSWHWPPVSRASANVLGTLFADAPPAAFRVLTRRMPAEAGAEPVPALDTETVRWPLRDDRPVRLWTWLAGVRTVLAMVARASRMQAEAPVRRVIAVYPHGYGLIAGALVARWLGVPLVAYMHDLCYETLITQSRARKWFWRWVDERILRQAALIVVPTPRFAAHYQSRGLQRTWVLPHCVPAGLEPAPALQRSPGEPLRLLYAGHVYEAHADAVGALVRATRDRPDVELEFLSQPHSVLRGQRTRWLDRPEAVAAVRSADVAVVALGFDTPYPVEIAGCFPSKLVDYFALGKPVLAVVPPGCFVESLVRESGCGVAVTSLEPAAIAAAVQRLQEDSLRAELGAAAADLAASLRSEDWLRELMERLAQLPLPVPVAKAFPPVRYGARRPAAALASPAR